MGERGGVERPKKKTIQTHAEEKRQKRVLELVLVWVERALRICRNLWFQERLFDQFYNMFYGLAWVFLIFSFFCKLGISGHPLHVTNEFGEILLVHLEGTPYWWKFLLEKRNGTCVYSLRMEENLPMLCM